MPKGHVEERECVCRACERPFLTTKVGRAKWYCRKPDCSSAAKPKHTGTRRQRRPSAEQLADRIARDAERQRAIAERREARDRATAERQQARERVRLVRALVRLLRRRWRELERAEARERKSREQEEAAERRREEHEQARAARERELAQAKRARQAKRDRIAREQRAAKLRVAIDRLRPKAQDALQAFRDAHDELHAKRAELAELEGRPVPAPQPAPAPAPAPARPPAREPEPEHFVRHGGGALTALLEELRAEVVALDLRGGADRDALKRAVVRFAHDAQGIPATRRALRAISVVTVAWEYRLRGAEHAKDPKPEVEAA